MSRTLKELWAPLSIRDLSDLCDRLGAPVGGVFTPISDESAREVHEFRGGSGRSARPRGGPPNRTRNATLRWVLRKKEKAPPARGASGHNMRLFVLGLAAELELAAFGLAEAGLALLGLQLAQYCGIQRGCWR